MKSSAIRVLALTLMVGGAACSSSTKLSTATTSSVASSTSASVTPTTVAPTTTVDVATTAPATTLVDTTVVTTTAAPVTTIAPATTAAPTTAAPPVTASSSTAPPATAPPTTAPPATAAPTTAAPATTQAVAGNACRSANLALTVGDTDGAAGNQYTPIIFTNNGSSDCTLDGHPGVSFVDNAGNQVGASADRVPGSTPTITLSAHGGQAHATMDYHDPGFFDNCNPQPATTLKVYPPDETVALTVAFPVKVCTATIPQAEVTIDVVKAGIALP